MKRMTDDQWLAAARVRASGLSTPAWEIAPDLTPAEPVAPPATSRCPACAEPPVLLPLPRYEHAAVEAWLFCPQCYGLLVPAAGLATGPARGDEHPAFESVLGPPRCRACFGHLKPDGVCAKCGWTRPAVSCPACHVAMLRRTQKNIQLDDCPKCHAAWFDTGEIAEIYGRPEAQPSLVEEAIAHRAVEGEAITGAVFDGNSPGDLLLNLGIRALFQVFG